VEFTRPVYWNCLHETCFKATIKKKSASVAQLQIVHRTWFVLQFLHLAREPRLGYKSNCDACRGLVHCLVSVRQWPFHQLLLWWIDEIYWKNTVCFRERNTVLETEKRQKSFKESIRHSHQREIRQYNLVVFSKIVLCDMQILTLLYIYMCLNFHMNRNFYYLCDYVHLILDIRQTQR